MAEDGRVVDSSSSSESVLESALDIVITGLYTGKRKSSFLIS